MVYMVYDMLFPWVSLVSPIGAPAKSYALYGMSYAATSNIICFECDSLWLVSHECFLWLSCTVSVGIPMVSMACPVNGLYVMSCSLHLISFRF